MTLTFPPVERFMVVVLPATGIRASPDRDSGPVQSLVVHVATHTTYHIPNWGQRKWPQHFADVHCLLESFHLHNAVEATKLG
jgi:hypothetical protein